MAARAEPGLGSAAQSAAQSAAWMRERIGGLRSGLIRSTAIPTGLPDLDRATNGGFQRGQLWILAGRPGMGKTVAMTTLSRLAARAAGVLAFQCEVTRDQQMARYLADLSYLHNRSLPFGRIMAAVDLDEEEMWRLPERFPRSVVERDKIPLGAYAVAGQFQQRPAPREGGLFDRAGFGIVDALPPIEKWVRAWGFAGTKKRPGADPDWTVGVKMGRGADKRFYIADVVRVRETPGQVRQRLINTAGQDGAAVGIRIPKDAGQAGIAQAEDYVTALAGFIVSAVAPTGSKEVRAKPLSSQVEVGNVLLLRGPWNEAFLEELGMFPAGSHDDQVDAIADAFNELAGVLPGEGLIAFYRRQIEAVTEPKVPGHGWSLPSGATESATIEMVAPIETGTVIGLSGARYTPDARGYMTVLSDDAGPLRAAEFVDAPMAT